MTRLKFFISMLCCFNVALSIEYKKVLTTLGPIKGQLLYDEITGATFYSFQGIPYAEAPVGDLRFKPPVQKKSWSSVRDATKPGHVCPQIELYYTRKEMDENCLYINFYSPAINVNKLLPVMVYIHGGDFKLGSGNAEPIYGPQFFVQNGVVVVTMNYRLGVLGFLSLCNEEVSGNAGIKDVLLALQIIKENIECFGGDPNNITVVGNGSGAVIVQYLMLTKKSVDLFHKVIIQSGSILGAQFNQLYPRKYAMLLRQELGISSKNHNDVLKKLRELNTYEIIKAQEAIIQRDLYKENPFKATVEIECESAIIIRPPLELIREGAMRNIPMSVGFNNQEGVEILPQLRTDPELINRLNDNIELLIPADILYPYGSAKRRNLASSISKRYFDGENISYANIPNFIRYITDMVYIYPIDYFIYLFKQLKCAPVYYYIFEGDTELNWFKKSSNITYPGAAHNDDFGYTFLTSITKPLYPYLEPTTKRALDSTVTNIKYFIYYGKPAPNPYVSFWPEAGEDNNHLRQGDNAVPIFHRPYPERIDFWYNVYEEYFNSAWSNGTYFCTNDDVQSVQ